VCLLLVSSSNGYSVLQRGTEYQTAEFLSYLQRTALSRTRSLAAAARHYFQTLDFLAHGFLEDGVGQEDQPVRGRLS
jgi:hypothetical protein